MIIKEISTIKYINNKSKFVDKYAIPAKAQSSDKAIDDWITRAFQSPTPEQEKYRKMLVKKLHINMRRLKIDVNEINNHRFDDINKADCALQMAILDWVGRYNDATIGEFDADVDLLNLFKTTFASYFGVKFRIKKHDGFKVICSDKWRKENPDLYDFLARFGAGMGKQEFGAFQVKKLAEIIKENNLKQRFDIDTNRQVGSMHVFGDRLFDFIFDSAENNAFLCWNTLND